MFIIKAKILGITKPPVWRKFRCADDATFGDLNDYLTYGFGWDGFHLHEFRSSLKGRDAVRIGRADDDDFWQGPPEDENEVQIQHVFSRFRKFYWIYDFGDNWEVELTCTGVSDEPCEGIHYDGSKGKAPPEDCGGVYAYERIKYLFREDPEGEEAEEMREWLGLDEGENWDPN